MRSLGRAQRIARKVAFLFACSLLLIAVLLGVLWIEHRSATALQTPTGSFAVGRVDYVWKDDAHPDPLSPVPGAKRQLFVWIWYPAARNSSQPTANYLPARLRDAFERHGGVLLSRFLTRDLSRVRTHSICDPALPPERLTYPILLMRAGHSALTLSYTSLAEDLASHGYVVVGFDAPYRTLAVVRPDGAVVERADQNNAELLSSGEQIKLGIRLVQAWSADLSFALDQMERLNASDPSGRFLGRLDLQRVGAFGHSLGGATALQFCRDDPRCKAGADVDGAPLGDVIATGVPKPFLFLLSDHKLDPKAEVRQVEGDIRSIYERLPPDARWEIVLHGANHFGFSDDGALLKSHIFLAVIRQLTGLRMDGRRQLAITSRLLRSFFDQCLRGEDRMNGAIASSTFPEVEIRR